MTEAAKQHEGENILWQNSPDGSRTNVFLTETRTGLVRLSRVEDGETDAQFPMLGSKLLEMAQFIIKDAKGSI